MRLIKSCPQNQNSFLLGNNLHIHILGICGTFMAGLAGLAIEKGHKVTGQDKAYYAPMSDQLAQLGIEENISEDPIESLINCDAVIIGNSQSRGNHSVEFTLSNDLDYFSGPEWLKENILKDKFVFVVAGTHGKTTTTSMLIKILKDNNCNPSFLVGGIYKEENISYKYTSSKYFVIEGDEYDTAFFDKRSKFFHYKPDTLIINNLEYDHSDIFENLEQIQKQFHYLIRTMSGNTSIIYNKGDKNISSLLSMGCWSKKTASRKFSNIANIIGDHNLQNASSAVSAAKTIGINESDSISALEKFSGVKRRLELIDNKNFILYDDFAHHPTAIAATLSAVKNRHPGKKITTIFEVRSNSMVSGSHKDNFYSSFDLTDELYIYCTKDARWLKDSGDFLVYQDISVIIDKIYSSTENVDVVILMSNGDTSHIIKKLNKYE